MCMLISIVKMPPSTSTISISGMTVGSFALTAIEKTIASVAGIIRENNLISLKLTIIRFYKISVLRFL